MRRLAPWVCVALLALSLTAPAADAAFGLKPAAAGLSVSATDSAGAEATLAGSHPGALKLGIGFNLDSSSHPEGNLRDLYLELPQGLIENPSAINQCSRAQFLTPRSSPYGASRSGESCPDASQVGVVEIQSEEGTRSFGLFSLTPPSGAPSRIGFNAYGAPVSFTPQVRQGSGQYGITLATERYTQLFETRSLGLTLWGNPWASVNDGQRGDCLNEQSPTSPHAQCPVALGEQTHGPRAYLTLPSECSAPPTFTVQADSWGAPGALQTATAQLPAALTHCEELGFFGLASVAPSARSVSSPTGLSFSLESSQSGLLSPSGRLTSQVKRAVVALPEGITINPSVGAGLGACTQAQFAAESATSSPGAGCPNPSKIGSGTVQSPLVEGSLSGSLFIATPFQNPFGSPYALYFVAKSPERGFIVKVPGRLEADPASGRLTATFTDLPQLPYTKLTLLFREGQRAPLVSPAACGKYTSQISLGPWTDPTSVLTQTSSFQIDRGITDGGRCPSGGAPFAPKASTGTLNSNAGSRTPFYLHLTRTDAEQEITSYSATLPPGLLGAIAGIPYCPDASIEAAKGHSGSSELASPSCPTASRIGHTFSGYGAGLAPAYAPGTFYLAGPYHGAPLSVVAINPAIVGPFDLGTVVIRSAIQVDPHTAQVTIDSSASDPIPHIFAGIPLRLRDVRVFIDRPNFMVNPTSCNRFSIASTLSGSDVPFANPRSALATATVPFQVSSCGALKFSPAFSLRLSGPTRRGAYPTLVATYAPRPGDANLSSAAVTLPPSIFLAQNHIETICTRVQFAQGACPAAAAIGTARATTPLLGVPLEGPVYLRSSDNPLPDLVTELRGQGIRILLEGRIDSHQGGIRARFEGLPDAGISSFQMTIAGGKKRGILQASEQLCHRSQIADARFVSQANLGVALKPKLSMRCRGKSKARAKAKRGRDR